MNQITDRYLKIQNIIANLEQKHARRIEFMAVTKSATQEEIISLRQAGCTLFGENKISSILEKWTEPSLDHELHQLHFIGHLQSNKLKTMTTHCQGILSLSKLKHIDWLVSHHVRDKRLFVQVNIGYESQKSGVIPEELSFLLLYAQKHHMRIEGLTCIPPAHLDPVPFFRKARLLGQEHNLPGLSLGMSSDYLKAIEEGSTMVRIGRALFS